MRAARTAATKRAAAAARMTVFARLARALAAEMRDSMRLMEPAARESNRKARLRVA